MQSYRDTLVEMQQSRFCLQLFRLTRLALSKNYWSSSQIFDFWLDCWPSHWYTIWKSILRLCFLLQNMKHVCENDERWASPPPGRYIFVLENRRLSPLIYQPSCLIYQRNSQPKAILSTRLPMAIYKGIWGSKPGGLTSGEQETECCHIILDTQEISRLKCQ